jgi:hypothetical protein
MNRSDVKSLTVPVCSFVAIAILSEVTPKKAATKMAPNGIMNMIL